MNINNSNQTIRSEQSSQSQSPAAETENYTIQSGETLGGIARRLGVKIDTLLDLNPQITDPNLIFAGHNLKIPKASPQTEQQVTPPTTNATPSTVIEDVVEEPTVPNANLNPENNTTPTLDEPGTSSTVNKPNEVQIDPSKETSATDEIVGFLDKMIDDPDLQVYGGIGITTAAITLPVVGQIVSGLAAVASFLSVFSDIKAEMGKENPSIGNVLKESWSKLAMGALFTLGALAPGAGVFGGLFMMSRGIIQSGQAATAPGATTGPGNMPIPASSNDTENADQQIREALNAGENATSNETVNSQQDNVDDAETAETSTENITPENNTEPRLNIRNYEIQSGDTLSKIASQHQTTIPELLALNSETITDPDKIYAGTTIKIPVLETPEQNS